MRKPKKVNYDTRIDILVSKQIKDQLQAMADKKGIYLSSYVRMLIIGLIEKENRGNNEQ